MPFYFTSSTYAYRLWKSEHPRHWHRKASTSQKAASPGMNNQLKSSLKNIHFWLVTPHYSIIGRRSHSHLNLWHLPAHHNSRGGKLRSLHSALTSEFCTSGLAKIAAGFPQDRSTSQPCQVSTWFHVWIWSWGRLDAHLVVTLEGSFSASTPPAWDMTRRNAPEDLLLSHQWHLNFLILLGMYQNIPALPYINHSCFLISQITYSGIFEQDILQYYSSKCMWKTLIHTIKGIHFGMLPVGIRLIN